MEEHERFELTNNLQRNSQQIQQQSQRISYLETRVANTEKDIQEIMKYLVPLVDKNKFNIVF